MKSRRDATLAGDVAQAFLKRERMVQRVGTGVLTLFVLAGAAGVFGNGPLSHAVETKGGVTIAYERFTRHSVYTELTIETNVAPPGPAEIRIARAFLNDVEVAEVRPAGALQRLDATVGVFLVPAPDGRATLQMRYAARRYGILRADVAGGAASAEVRQLVFF